MSYRSPAERGSRASSLALVIGLHAAAIAGALLAKSTVLIPDTGEITKLVHVAPIEDPPPLPPSPEPQTEMPPPPAGSTAIVPPSIEAARPVIPPITPPGAAPPAPPLPPIASSPPTPPLLIDARFTAASLARLQPAYPGALLRAGVEGEVTVRVTIGPDGRVERVDKIRADHDAFFEATRRHALRAWRFAPATRDGLPVESSQTHTVRFTIAG